MRVVLKSKTADSRVEIAPLVGQVRVAMIDRLDREFLLDEELARLEVTSAQFVILSHLLKGGSGSACELCKNLNYDRGAMSRMIDRLESKGLLRRVALAHTRRTVALEVPAAGKAAYPKMEACASRTMNRLLHGISSAEIDQLEKVLRKMIANG